jgi:hypothetical protein
VHFPGLFLAARIITLNAVSNIIPPARPAHKAKILSLWIEQTTSTAPAGSPFEGVSRHRDKREVSIAYRGEDSRLGLFDHEITPAKAQDRKALESSGEFADL